MLRRPALPRLTGHERVVRGTRGRLVVIAFAAAASLLASTAGARPTSRQQTAPTATSTDAPRLPPVELGARLAYGLPVGDVDTHQALAGTVADPLKQTISGMVPIWIDGGFRFASGWFGGLFFAFAPGFPGEALRSNCGDRCSVFDMRLGAEVHYHLAADKRWDPWLGAGLGYEWLHIGATNATSSQSTGIWASGFELLNLQAGLDVAVGTGGHVGPFAALTTAVYSWSDSLPSSNTFSGPALHAWVVLGVRGTLNFPPKNADPPKPDSPE